MGRYGKRLAFYLLFLFFLNFTLKKYLISFGVKKYFLSYVELLKLSFESESIDIRFVT